MTIQNANHTATIVRIGNQITATIVRNEIVCYDGGNIPAKMVAINWFTTEAEAEAWLNVELKKHN